MPSHWAETGEPSDERDPADVAPAQLQVEAGEAVARTSHRARLRAALADGQWHSSAELAEIAGLRFGGRVYELRRGADGLAALDIEAEARVLGGRQRWFYRLRPAQPWQGRLPL
jgi:hypothetical protein